MYQIKMCAFIYAMDLKKEINQIKQNQKNCNFDIYFSLKLKFITNDQSHFWHVPKKNFRLKISPKQIDI